MVKPHSLFQPHNWKAERQGSLYIINSDVTDMLSHVLQKITNKPKTQILFPYLVQYKHFVHMDELDWSCYQ